jgi:hypothetical protein
MAKGEAPFIAAEGAIPGAPKPLLESMDYDPRKRLFAPALDLAFPRKRGEGTQGVNPIAALYVRKIDGRNLRAAAAAKYPATKLSAMLAAN